jgi:hypothetical protein
MARLHERYPRFIITLQTQPLFGLLNRPYWIPKKICSDFRRTMAQTFSMRLKRYNCRNLMEISFCFLWEQYQHLLQILKQRAAMCLHNCIVAHMKQLEQFRYQGKKL